MICTGRRKLLKTWLFVTRSLMNLKMIVLIRIKKIALFNHSLVPLYVYVADVCWFSNEYVITVESITNAHFEYV